MRSLPTRREVIFVLAFIVSFVIFLEFGLGSSDSPPDPSLDSNWRKKVQIPWLGGSEYKPSVDKTKDAQGESRLKSLTHVLDVSGDTRNAVFTWGVGKPPSTNIKVHVPGWTVFDRLYFLNGTLFIVTDEPKVIPDRMLLTSSGYPVLNEPEEFARRMPTDKDMQIISPERASEIFGPYASRVDGTTFIINDPSQFIKHYYHWAAEAFLGLWKVYSSLDLDIASDGHTKLSAPRRLMMPHIASTDWRDYSSMNQWVTRGAFPSLSMEFQDDWQDRADMARPLLLDRVVLADRAAAAHSPNFVLTQRSIAELSKLPSSPHWWSTIRNNLIEFAGGDPDIHGGNVITYVSRQEWGRRMLAPEDHDRLVRALERLREQHGYEVNIVSMDKLTRQEQFNLAGRTTILMGVHGNGLTALLWMKPSRKATVMEFFYPPGFAYDYEWTTRALGMKHYGFWGSEYFTSPDLPPRNYPEGFQGSDIPLDGDVVAKLCHEILSLSDD